MKNLLIMVGAPGSGKSTWIKDNGLEQYALSPDTLRLMVSSPTMTVEGELRISQQFDNQAWSLMMSLLEDRMDAGMFTVIDATHTRKKYLNKYKDLAKKYRYRTFIKKMDVPIDELITRDGEREEVKKVPHAAIRMHAFRLETLHIPKGFTQIDSVTELNEFIFYPTVEGYDNIEFIGDIHSQYDTLKDWMNMYDRKTLYIFTGDYIDRGDKPVEVIRLLSYLHKRYGNVVLLEGNHEKWLKYYRRKDFEKIRSDEFKNNTLPKLSNLDDGVLKYFLNALRPFWTGEFNGQKYIATHGGLSTPYPDFISASQMINGVGKYEDTIDVYANYEKNHRDVIQVHGHRNTYFQPIHASKHIFNLEGKVERGGALRAVNFDAEGKHVAIYYDGSPTPAIETDVVDPSKFDVSTMMRTMSNHKAVQVKDLGDNISSFNFTKKAFARRLWDDVSVTARGLFINVDTSDIVARSYDKFFNLGEPQTKKSHVIKNIKFPVKAFKKENGFLGIVGYDHAKGEVFYASKSTNKGPYAEWVKELIEPHIEPAIETLKSGVSLVFEVMKFEADPHIVEYNHDHVVLLEGVHNQLEFKHIEIEELAKLGKAMNIEVKQTVAEFDNLIDLFTFIKHETNVKHEGFVFEGAEGLMFKIKSQWYSKWKHLRTLKDKCKRPGFMVTNEVFDDESVEFISWVQTNIDKPNSKSVVELRKMFYEK